MYIQVEPQALPFGPCADADTMRGQFVVRVCATPRPGRIAQSLTIDAPAGHGEEFRTSAEYAAQCRIVSAALHAAMEHVA